MPIFIIATIIILILLLLLFFLIYNSFIKLNSKTEEAFATMDVYLKKRWDLIPNLVSTVKGYAKHEKDTLESIILLRNTTYDHLSNENKMITNKNISNAIEKVMILTENYPELKASDNFKKLSTELAKIEDEIAASRKYYNATVRMYNNKVEMFPTNMIAKCLNFKAKLMFEIEKDERENIEIDV